MFSEKLQAAAEINNSFLCIGLDPDPELMAHPHIPSFLQEIVDATSDLVCAYKPNLAFFEALGMGGMQTMLESLRSIPRHIPIIADAKRGDIGNTARFYARALFDVYKFDAVTVNAYGGRDAVQPFIDYAERGVLVWCRSSNPGAADLQDMKLESGPFVYEAIAERAREWNTGGNVGVVAGATWPEQIERVRDICPDMWLLVPGVGAQEGDLEAAVQAALNTAGGGFLLNASRAVLYTSKDDGYAKSARKAAQRLRNRINVMREAALARR
ncbi:MAG: orotidine-5'-phosphate decarboxylase [Chloroflexi bacterium]|nr:MAG: orotidine-5'-phosphate decarboxylase [Chloroflexota bacterium]